MTEELNKEEMKDIVTAPEESVETAVLPSTREIMEQNWDRFMKMQEETKQATEEEDPSLAIETPAPLNEQGEGADPFDASAYLNENFESLKETLSKRGIQSAKEWINSLVALEKLYQESPKEVIKQLALQAGFSLPTKQEAAFHLKQYALSNNIPMEKMFLSLLGDTHSLPAQKETPHNFLAKTDFSSLKEEIQKMMKEELSSYFKEKQAETKKAKNSSFSPQGVGTKSLSSSTHTPEGKLKTTRQILEEGCRLLGL